jgi:hypothetical protein
MPDFTRLPVYDGEGPYHFNRFRAVFQKPDHVSAATLANRLVTHFPDYLNSKFASVEFKQDFDSKPTLRFHGFKEILGLDIAKPHHDWVVREWCDTNVGFTAQTLKREFRDLAEDAEAFGGGLVASGGVGAFVAVHYNRMHFLAGRRSWRVGEGGMFEESQDALVVETVAVERFSAKVFRTADAVLGLEKAIPEIWIANLTNFINSNGLAVLASAKKSSGSWVTRDPVCYFVQTYDNLFYLQGSMEFQRAYRLYPTILPPTT